jgi:hypothetical protein
MSDANNKGVPTVWIRQKYEYQTHWTASRPDNIDEVMNLFGEKGWAIFHIDFHKNDEDGYTGAYLFMRREK